MSLLVLVTSPLALAADLTANSGNTSKAIATSLEATASGGAPQLDPAIAGVWSASDGPVADGSVSRALVWGDAPLAIAVEHYRDSPTGLRTMVYFDKGRLDVLDPSKPTDDAWYVSGALLVREMLSGEIQFGTHELVQRDPAQIPVVGDPGQTDALTYATLAPLATLRPALTAKAGTLGLSEQDSGSSQTALARVGRTITALLNSKGAVAPQGVANATVQVGAYDGVTGHNVAAPFNDWSNSQAEPGLYLLGHPLTEPYWLDITVNGQPQRVLLQAFERRILTYTPGNLDGFQVESANVGLHYRQWRGLAQPSDPSLVALASGEPFGEELVSAATSNLIDPYLFVAMARTASGGDPLAQLANGGHGLLGVRDAVAQALNPKDTAAVTPDKLAQQISMLWRGGRILSSARHGALPESSLSLADPQRNSGYAAIELARWLPESLDWHDILGNYYSGGQPNWDDPAQNAFVDQTLAAYADLLAKYPHSDDVSVPTDAGTLLGTGHAAYYSPSYDRAWWERTLRLYDSWGEIAPGWQNDPNGYYCVRPGYVPGMRLMLVANGVTITCTIGDTVATPHLASWRAHWVVELSYSSFAALHLDENNTVDVIHIGTDQPPAMPEPPAEASPIPTPEPTPAPPTDTPTPPLASPPSDATPPADATPSPAPTEPGTPGPTVTPSAPPSDATPVPTETETATATPAATATATATATGTVTPTPTAPTHEPGGLVGVGVALQSPGNQPLAWWDATLVDLANSGQAINGWQHDPRGYYCVQPDYLPGERLTVSANGVTIECTIGNVVPPDQVDAWRAQWVVELNDEAWRALGLDASSVGTSTVEVRYLSP
jgi:hypothetical protein